VLVVATTDGAAAGTAAGTFSGYDVITGFTTGTDDIVFDSNTNGDDVVNTAIIAGSVVVSAATAATTASNDITISNFMDVDQVVNYINDLIANAAYTPDTANADLFAVTIGSGTTGTTVLYHVVDDGAAVDATEITLIATVNGVLVAGDLLIA
jgi:hypothetical protein